MLGSRASGRPIWLPPGSWNRRHPHGRHTLDGPAAAQLLVSRGVGYGGLPLRPFSPAEVIAVTISWEAATPWG